MVDGHIQFRCIATLGIDSFERFDPSNSEVVPVQIQMEAPQPPTPRIMCSSRRKKKRFWLTLMEFVCFVFSLTSVMYFKSILFTCWAKDYNKKRIRIKRKGIALVLLDEMNKFVIFSFSCSCSSVQVKCKVSSKGCFCLRFERHYKGKGWGWIGGLNQLIVIKNSKNPNLIYRNFNRE